MNTGFVNQKLSKRGISNYFQKQNDLSNNLNKLFEEFDDNSQISGGQNYMNLRNAFERNKNLTKKISEKYNSTIEQNSKYINYPKLHVE